MLSNTTPQPCTRQTKAACRAATRAPFPPAPEGLAAADLPLFRVITSFAASLPSLPPNATEGRVASGLVLTGLTIAAPIPAPVREAGASCAYATPATLPGRSKPRSSCEPGSCAGRRPAAAVAEATSASGSQGHCSSSQSWSPAPLGQDIGRTGEQRKRNGRGLFGGLRGTLQGQCFAALRITETGQDNRCLECHGYNSSAEQLREHGRCR